MAKNNGDVLYKPMVTPKAIVKWAKLYEPEVYNGTVVGRTIQLYFDEDTSLKFKEMLLGIIDTATTKDDTFRGKKFMAEPFIGEHEDKDGNTFFKFKMKAEYKDKNGHIHETSVPLFDAVGNQLDPKLLIGNGSICRVNFTAYPYFMNRNNNGLTLRLNCVQVLKLVEYQPGGRTASDYGFDTEEGGFIANKQQVFKSPEEVAEEEADPFNDVPPDDLEGSDF